MVASSRKTRWPDCSPPKQSDFASRASRTLRSPTADSTTSIPADAERPVQAEVAHHGHDDRAAAERPLGERDRWRRARSGGRRRRRRRARRRRSADRRRRRTRRRGRAWCSTHRAGERGDVGRAEAVVDVRAVGRGADHVELDAEPGEHLRRDDTRGAVGTVTDDLQPRRPDRPGPRRRGAPRRRRCRVESFSITPTAAPETVSLVSPASSRSISSSIARSSASGSFEPFGDDELDAVVVEGVVRGRDHRRRDASASLRGRRARASAGRRGLAPGRLRRRCRRRARRAASAPSGGCRSRRGTSPREGDEPRPDRWPARARASPRRWRGPGSRRCRNGPPRGDQRLEYCGALRAFFRPYFLLSFSRASRVRRPAFFSAAAELGVHLDQAAGDAESKRAGLAGDAAAVDRRFDVEALGAVGDPQWLGGVLASRCGGEVLLERALVDRDRTVAVTKTDAGDRGLSSAGCLDEWLRHSCSS